MFIDDVIAVRSDNMGSEVYSVILCLDSTKCETDGTELHSANGI